MSAWLQCFHVSDDRSHPVIGENVQSGTKQKWPQCHEVTPCQCNMNIILAINQEMGLICTPSTQAVYSNKECVSKILSCQNLSIKHLSCSLVKITFTWIVYDGVQSHLNIVVPKLLASTLHYICSCCTSDFEILLSRLMIALKLP